MGDINTDWNNEDSQEIVEGVGAPISSGWYQTSKRKPVTLFADISAGTLTIQVRNGISEDYLEPFVAYGLGPRVITLDFNADIRVDLTDTGRVDGRRSE